MRIIVYGAGAIGSTVGGYLGRSGQEVILIGRSGHMNAINKRGLRIIGHDRIHIVKLKTVTDVGQIMFKSDDVVFLTLKGQDTQEALKSLQAVAGDLPVFCVQNGVRNEETASKYFTRVYGATVYTSALFDRNGEVTCRRDPPGGFIIGRYPQGIDDVVEAVAEKLRTSGFAIVLSPNVMSYKWGKLFQNLGNAVSGITDAKGDEADFIVSAAKAELQALVDAAGIKVITRADLSKLESEFYKLTNPEYDQLRHHSQGSTWQSLTRQSGSVETEFLNGEAVRLAGKMDKKAPINEKINTICNDMAVNRIKPGKYTPAELGYLLGL